MPNPYMPRESVHAWSEEIGDAPTEHQAVLQRVLKGQRRLTKFIEENQAEMKAPTAGVSVYLIGVVVRLFDRAGGQLRSATWEQVRAASARVGAAIGELLPADDGFPDRVRQVAWRAQPHILDEALMALFEREEKEEIEVDLDRTESLKAFLLLWVATEVLDENWNPPKSFRGETEYAHVHIEPKKRAPAEG